MKTKQCNSKNFPERACRLNKPIDQFSKNSSLCKECQNNYAKQHYLNNKEEKITYAKQYYQNNKEKIKYNNQTKKSQKTIYNKQYYQINKEKAKTFNKQYRQANKVSINARKAKNEKRHRLKDPSYKLRQYFSIQIGHALKANASSKEGHSILEYLNYTKEKLKAHLENQFEPWMNWNNHGKYNAKIWNDKDPNTWTWQIDHIIPQSDLPYMSMKDDNFKKCWALSNLRPLSAKQNCLDGVNRIRHQTLRLIKSNK